MTTEEEQKKITKTMIMSDVVSQYPATEEVFQKYGINCKMYAAAKYESIYAGARVHGVDPDKLVNDLNTKV